MPVAVLIVNYRSYEALDRCLISLWPHLSDGDEVVIVDAASNAALVAPLRERHPGATWILRPDNTGFSAGINAAAAASTAPYLMFLNPDTEVQGAVVRVLEQWLAGSPDRGVAGPRVLNSDDTLQPSARRFPGLSTVFGGRSTWLTRRWPNNWLSRRNLLRRDAREPGEVDWVSGSCLATPRRVFDQLHGLDESFFLYWEDADYCRRVTALGLRCHYVPTAAIRHAGGVSSANNLAGAIRAFHASAFHLYWKHSTWGRVFAPLVWAGLKARAELRVLETRR